VSAKQPKNRKRDISPEALAELRESIQGGLFKPGQAVMVITVTLYYVGMVLEANENELVLSNMGIFTEVDNMTNTLSGKKAPSVEMCPDDGIGVINRGAIIAAFPWYNAIPVPVT
jgi:hypothetical protein